MQDRASPALVIDGLKAALEAHAQGRVFDIGDGWDAAAGAGHDDDRVSLALSLWESWADSAAHGWQFYDGMTADDWPRFASHVLDALERGLPVTDPIVLARFGPQEPSQPSLLKPRLVASSLIVAVGIASLVTLEKVAYSVPGLAGTMLLVASFFGVPVLTLMAIRSANRRIEERHAPPAK